MLVGKLHVALESRELKQFGHTTDKFHEVGLLTVQVHLLLVHLTEVENLVDQGEYAIGIALDDVQFFLGILVHNLTFHQRMERTHDQCEGRTNVVGGIDQRFHLVFLELMGLATVVIGHAQVHKETKKQQINQPSQGGTVPRRLDDHRENLDG